MTRGRPKGTKKAFLQDRDRYAVALADALQDYGFSQRGAFDMAAVIAFGQSTGKVDLPPGAVPIEGFTALGFQMSSPMVGVASRASTLLKKGKRATSPDDLHWRSMMKAALSVALFMREMGGNQKRQIVLMLCESIGEADFAEAVLGTLLR